MKGTQYVLLLSITCQTIKIDYWEWFIHARWMELWSRSSTSLSTRWGQLAFECIKIKDIATFLVTKIQNVVRTTTIPLIQPPQWSQTKFHHQGSQIFHQLRGWFHIYNTWWLQFHPVNPTNIIKRRTGTKTHSRRFLLLQVKYSPSSWW